jgi:hypothetical protein
MGHATLERVRLFGPRSADYIRASGHNVKFVFGLSPAIHKMVTEGQTADVVITQPNFINELGMRAYARISHRRRQRSR